ncbi:MAG: hypothetical protein WBD81_17850 [Collimonas pratensis]|uniref:hypothetical protein n=1 Tax=Collimonas pratensis TaxID=279113 RepID=UPI003C73B1FF
MSGFPPIDLPSSDLLDFFLGPLQPVSKYWNTEGGSSPIPTLDQLPISVTQLVAMATRVNVWQITGEIDFSGDDAPDPIIFDDTAVSTTSFNGTAVDSIIEPWIQSGLYTQSINLTPPLPALFIAFHNVMGYPSVGLFDNQAIFQGVLMDDSNNLYLNGQPLPNFGALGGSFGFSFGNGSVNFSWAPYSSGVTPSAVTLDILGVPQLNLFGGGYSATGAVHITAKSWLSYNGIYNTSTGARN